MNPNGSLITHTLLRFNVVTTFALLIILILIIENS